MFRPFTFVLPFLLVASAYAQDANEPNDTFDDATALALGASATGTIHENGDRDVFAVSVDEPGVLVIELTGVPGVNWSLELYDPDRDRLRRWTSNIGAGLSVAYLVEPGVHYVDLEDSGNNGSSAQPYTLEVSLDTEDGSEPNDTFDEAAPVTFGETVTGTIRTEGDQDVYVVNVETPGVLEVDVSGISNVEWDVEIYDAARDRELRRTANTGAAILVTHLVDVGEYFVQLSDVGDGDTSADPYTLTVSLDLTDPNELNNTFATATLIGPDTFVPGTIWTFGDEDFYAFDVTTPGTIEIEIRDVPTNVALRADLYDPDQDRRRDIRQGNAGQSYTYQVDLPFDGRHYLVLSDVSDNDISPEPYTVRLTGGVIDDGRDLETGDVNANGVVDAGDASLVLRSIVGLASLTTSQRAVADVDDNGLVQAADASMILQVVVGLLPGFPGDGVAPLTVEAGTLVWGTWERVQGTDEYVGSVNLQAATSASTSAEVRVWSEEVEIMEVRALAPEGWLAASRPTGSGETTAAMAGTTGAFEGPVFEVRVRATRREALDGVRAEGVVGAGVYATLAYATADDADADDAFTLAPVHPNPVRSGAMLRYTVPEAGHVRLEVFTARGRRVATLVDGVRMAGEHRTRLETAALPAGAYLCRLETEAGVQTRPLVVVK